MSYLYHYCTADAANSILTNRTLRLSDIRKSNDSKEIDYLFDEYKKWWLKKNQYHESAQHSTEHLETLKKTQMENTVFLVSCFSRNEDDLHMWSCYGNKGVCFSFNREKLREYIKQICIGMTPSDAKQYTTTSCALKLEDVQYFSEEGITRFFNEQNLNGSYDDFFPVFKKSPIIKSDFFKIEKETRIILTHINGINTPHTLSRINENGKVIESIPFKSISSDLFRHKMVVDIPINIDIIEKIIIGPNSTLSKQDVEQILFINGIENIEVTKSVGTYR